MAWQLANQHLADFDRLKARSQTESKPMVLWGWKRDQLASNTRQPESRTVYFSADLTRHGPVVAIDRAFFFLENRATHQHIASLKSQNHQASTWVDRHYPGYSRFRLKLGRPTTYDLATIRRRLQGRPRLSIPPPQLVSESGSFDLSPLAPFALCVGSGLSAESGLPLLGSIHNLFAVDNFTTQELVFGANDPLPQSLATDQDRQFNRFCDFTIKAITAQPSPSHHLIAQLYRQGVIKQIFTDNMDDILAKVNVSYARTRLSIFPDRFPAQFDPGVKSLLVVGVAVDRRDVIKQARRKGLKIIAVNPVYGVAPYSRNMDYLRPGDIFFKTTAKITLPKIIQATGF